MINPSFNSPSYDDADEFINAAKGSSNGSIPTRRRTNRNESPSLTDNKPNKKGKSNFTRDFYIDWIMIAVTL